MIRGCGQSPSLKGGSQKGESVWCPWIVRTVLYVKCKTQTTLYDIITRAHADVSWPYVRFLFQVSAVSSGGSVNYYSITPAYEHQLTRRCPLIMNNHTGIGTKTTPLEEDGWEDKPCELQLRGWSAVSAARLQGTGSRERTVFCRHRHCLVFFSCNI